MTIDRTAPYAALLLRLSLGVLFLAHGLLKAFVFTLPGTAKFFESLGYPGALAYVVVALEIGGGLLLLSGLFTRAVSVALIASPARRLARRICRTAGSSPAPMAAGSSRRCGSFC